MKKMMRLFGFILTSMLVITACEDDDNQVSVSSTVLAPVVVDANETEIDLFSMQNLSSNPVLSLVWDDADYGVQTEINYIVQVSSDQAFTNPVEAGRTQSRNFTFTVGELNVDAQVAGLPAEEQNPLYMRVVSFLGSQDTGAAVESQTITVNVTPYFAYLFRDLFLVGNGTAADWNNNNNNPPLFRSQNDENFYTYTGFFNKPNSSEINDGRWKVLEFLGQWQPQWGVTAGEGSDAEAPSSNTSGAIAGNPATQSGDPGRFGVDESGYYTFTFDYAGRTFSITPYTDEATATDYTSMSLTGTAGDIALTQSTFDSHIWNVSNVDLATGSAQFVANDGTTWGNPNEFNGTATVDGGEVPVSARNYNVWFNDLTGDYMIIPNN